MLQMNVHNLLIWNRSIELADSVHRLTKTYPRDERYELVSQMRRAAVSIPSNIAEGSQRTTNKEFAHFILIAKGSLAELQTQILLSKRYGYIADAEWRAIDTECDELHRMLHAFHSRLVTRHS